MSVRAWRAIVVRRSARVPVALLPLSARCHRRARTARGGRSARRRPHRSADARGRVVHRLAGARVDRADDPRRVPRGLRSRSLPIPWTQPGRRARRRPVRAPDGGRRARVPRDPPRRHRARMGADPDRARVLQRRRRRADRRDVLGEPRPRGSEAAATLGASPSARFREITLPLLAPALAAAAAIVFLFSFTSFGDRPDPRRPAVRDDRGRDLQPGGPPVRPAGRGRPLARAARVRRRGRVGRDAAGTATRRRPVRCAPSATRSAGCARCASRLVVVASLGGLALFLGLPLVVLVERSLAVRRRIRARRLPSARRPDERPARRSVGSRRELDRVRVSCDRDRASSSAGSPRSPWPTRADRGCSTGSCCCRSAPRR